MPDIVIEVPITATGTALEVSRKTERGRLKSLSWSAILGAPYKGTLWMEVGCKQGGATDEFITATFFSGLIGLKNRCIWTGDYKIEPYEILYVKCISLYTGRLRVSGRIEIEDP